MMTDIPKLQELFLKWISNVGRTRYALIKEVCEYLCNRYEVDITLPQYKIFYPLFQSGVIEFCGNGHYAPSPRTTLTDGNNTLTNYSFEGASPTSVIGLYFKKGSQNANIFNGREILKKLPSVDKIVENYPVGLIDTSQFKKEIGIVGDPEKLYTDYFRIKEKNFLVKIPSMDENPDAKNVAFMYEAFLTGNDICSYNEMQSTLSILHFGIPIVIYRVLMIECLLHEKTPKIDGIRIVFSGIRKSTAKEVNRILLNSMKYE